jgi:protein-tyrosine phosphatase
MAMAMAMAMAMNIHITQQMIDIHTHLMYQVDDGSKNLEMTREMISISSYQGVKVIFLTPHVNASITENELKEFNNKYNEISLLAKTFGIKCFLGAEIYISYRIPNINFNNFTMGKSKVLLLEFSTYLETPLIEHTYNLIKKGFKIILAHIERYDYLSLNDIVDLKNMGAYLQVNSTSVIKKGKSKTSKRAWKYIKNNLIDFIATDSHNTSSRAPNMKEAYKILLKKYGNEKANKIFNDNASKLLLNNNIVQLI